MIQAEPRRCETAVQFCIGVAVLIVGITALVLELCVAFVMDVVRPQW